MGIDRDADIGEVSAWLVCPDCGSDAATASHIDHYVSLFSCPDCGKSLTRGW